MKSLENFNVEPNIKEKYTSKADADGYVLLSDFATQECDRQTKNIASLLDGDEGTAPEYNLGEGLHYQGKSGSYFDMKIHINDLETFIKRVQDHYR